MHILLILITAIFSLSSPALASTGEGKHVNIVSFQPLPGKKLTDLPDGHQGPLHHFMDAVEGKAEPLVIAHTPHIHPGDVINLQLDVLGQASNGNLEDDGLNCQLSYTEPTAGTYSIGGTCRMISAEDNGNSSSNIIIRPFEIHPSEGDQSKWVLLFHNEQAGVAAYANLEP